MKFLVQQQPAYVYTGGKPFDAARPSVVFIHGSANDHSVWTYQARYFAHHGWNALAVDLPGHGKSFANAKVHISDIADWIIDLLNNGAIARAALVGHSMGSLVALDAALRHRERTSHTVLVGCSVPMAVSDALLDAARNRPHEAFDMLNLWGHAAQLKWGRNPTPGTSSLMAYRRLLAQSRPGVLATDLAACAAYLPDDSQLAGAPSGIRLITGEQDLLTPLKAGRALCAKLPGAKIDVMPGCGHAIMQEAPGAFLDYLKKVLAA